MRFAKNVYLAQIITYSILLALLSLTVLFTAGLFMVSKVGNLSPDKALDYAIILVLMIVASAISLGFIFLLIFQLVTSIKLYKALNISALSFLQHKKSRVINSTFGIISIIAGIITSVLMTNPLLICITAILPTTILTFLILDKTALSKIKKEQNL